MQNSMKNIFLSSLMIGGLFSANLFAKQSKLEYYSLGYIVGRSESAASSSATDPKTLFQFLRNGVLATGEGIFNVKQKVNKFFATEKRALVLGAVLAVCCLVIYDEYESYRDLQERYNAIGEECPRNKINNQIKEALDAQQFAQEINIFCKQFNVTSFNEQGFWSNVKTYYQANKNIESDIHAVKAFAQEAVNLVNKYQFSIEKYRKQALHVEGGFANISYAVHNYENLSSYVNKMSCFKDFFTMSLAFENVVTICSKNNSTDFQKITDCLNVAKNLVDLNFVDLTFDSTKSALTPRVYLVLIFEKVLSRAAFIKNNQNELPILHQQFSILIPQIEKLIMILKEDKNYKREALAVVQSGRIA